MNRLQTSSFELAVYAQGNVEAERLALVLPGKLDTKDYPHMRSHVEYLAQRGYFALSFDPPGTWESGGDIGLYTVTNYLQAIYELIAYFGNRPTLVIGHSLGGSLALIAGTKNSYVTHFGAIMSRASYSPQSYAKFFDQEWQQTGYRISRRDIPGQKKSVREFSLPYHFVEDLIQYDASEELRQSSKPKMFVLGEQDVLITSEMVEEVYSLAMEPKALYRVNSGHDYRSHPEFIQHVNTSIGDFLDKYQK